MIFPEYGITSGVTVESPTRLFIRGSVMRGAFADRKSPIAYGYDEQRARLLQPGSGVERWRRLRRVWRVRRRRADSRRRPEHDADGDADCRSRSRNLTRQLRNPIDRRSTTMAQFRQMARQFGLDFDEVTPRSGSALPAKPQRHAAVGHIVWRAIPRRIARR